MVLQAVRVLGFRGFSSEGRVDFAQPDGKDGSGLTVLTGPNNSGKSTIIESLRLRHTRQEISFTVGARNTQNDYVRIVYDIDGKEEIVRSTRKGSSETVKENYDYKANVFVLPSRRAFNPYFGKQGLNTREEYLGNYGAPAQRSSTLLGFESRLFQIMKDPTEFNKILFEILPSEPQWTIDQADSGQYFLKFFNNESAHTSDGMGEGIISIFAIVDTLYDSKPGHVIAIDEPELSLHPSLQKRLTKLFMKFSQDRQIILSTHSPHFILVESLANGGGLARVVSGTEGTKILALSQEGKDTLVRLGTGNIYNPHVFGLDAKEIFFQEDAIILTEGQEDVVLLPSVASQLGMQLHGAFFGWGAGGAGNIERFCKILSELGFPRVVGILDGDKRNEADRLRQQFEKYKFFNIPADDMRTKPARTETIGKEGLLDEKLKIRDSYKADMIKIFEDVAAFAKQ